MKRASTSCEEGSEEKRSAPTHMASYWNPNAKSPRGSKFANIVLTTHYPLTESGSKKVVMGLNIKTMEPTLRLQDITKWPAHTVDLSYEETLKLVKLYEETKDVSDELIIQGSLDITDEDVYLKVIFLNNIPGMTFHVKGAQFTIARPTVKKFAELVPVLKANVTTLLRLAEKAPLWRDRFIQQLREARDVNDFIDQSRELKKAGDYKDAVQRWYEATRNTVLGKMTASDDIDASQPQFICEVCALSPEVFQKEVIRCIMAEREKVSVITL